MKGLLILAVLGALVVPVSAPADHAGCLASTLEPTCTYNAVGAHAWAAATPNAFEIWVTRNNVKVVLAARGEDPAGVVSGGFSDIAATPGELVTIEMIPTTYNLVIGFVSAGNTSGHP